MKALPFAPEVPLIAIFTGREAAAANQLLSQRKQERERRQKARSR